MTEKLSQFTALTPTLSSYIAGANAGSPNQKYLLSDVKSVIAGKVINAADFGVVADGNGLGGGTDNSAALIALGNYLLANPGCIVYWPQGIVCFTNQFWLTVVVDTTLDFTGCKLQNINPVSPHDQGALSVGNNWDINQIIGTSGQVAPGKYPINTVSRGSQQVVTTTAANAANLTPGTWAVIFGYDQQGSGFPFNCRYRDYVKIVTVDAATGIVTFDRPLTNDYNANWFPIAWTSGPFPAVNYTVGIPNIMSLQRGNQFQFADYVVIRNLEALTNPFDVVADMSSGIPNYGSNIISAFGCRYVSFENCIAQNSFAGDSDFVHYINCKIDTMQPDKNTNHLLFEGGQVQVFAGCQGYDNVFIKGTKIVNAISAQPRRLTIDQVYFCNQTSSGISVGGGLYGQELDIHYCVFDYAAAQPIFLGTAINVNAGRPDQPGPNSAVVVATGAGTMSFALGGGFRILAGKGTVLRRPSDGARFYVTDITYDGVNNVVSYTSAYAPGIGDVLYFYAVNEITFTGNTRTVYDRFPTSLQYTPALNYSDDRGYGDMIQEWMWDFISEIPFTSGLIWQTDGYITEIDVNVTTAYTGAGNGHIFIEQVGLFGGTGITPGGDITVNTKTTGLRTMTSTAASGGVAGDANIVALGPTMSPAIDLRYEADNNGATGFKGYIRIKTIRRH